MITNFVMDEIKLKMRYSVKFEQVINAPIKEIDKIFTGLIHIRDGLTFCKEILASANAPIKDTEDIAGVNKHHEFKNELIDIIKHGESLIKRGDLIIYDLLAVIKTRGNIKPNACDEMTNSTTIIKLGTPKSSHYKAPLIISTPQAIYSIKR
jgi:hypothetical protein